MQEPDRSEAAPTAQAKSSAFSDVPVTLVVSVGKARQPIGTLLSLDRNTVIPLDKSIDDPVVIYAGSRVVAYGELQELAEAPGTLAVRITEIAEPSDSD